MINLRGVYLSGDDTTSSLHLSKLSDIRFASITVGNLGAPLGFEEEERRSFTDRLELEGKEHEVANISNDPLKEYFPFTLNGHLGMASEENKVDS